MPYNQLVHLIKQLKCVQSSGQRFIAGLTYAAMQHKEQLASRKAATAAAEAQLYDGKQHAITVSHSKAFKPKVNLLDMLLSRKCRGSSHSWAQCAKVKAASDLNNADATFAHAGHSLVLLNLARSPEQYCPSQTLNCSATSNNRQPSTYAFRCTLVHQAWLWTAVPHCPNQKAVLTIFCCSVS